VVSSEFPEKTGYDKETVEILEKWFLSRVASPEFLGKTAFGFGALKY
jgi:hypothetical protein